MGSSSSKVTAQDRAVLDMKVQRDKLRQYQKRIRTVLEREQEIAKECLQKDDKQRALLALRKKKYQQQLLAKTDKQLETLEQLTQSIEFAVVQRDVLYGLEQGNEVLKAINKEMSLERVEKIMDDSAEGIAYQKEMSDMLASTITNSEELEVQEELEALEREELARKIPQLPQVPTTELPQEEEQEQELQEEEPQVKTAKLPILA
jgi:charged multivesicular body protein 6